MAYGEQLLSALSGMRVSPSEDPFGIAAQGIASGIPYLTNPYASTGSNMVSTVGAGLLSALLAGLAKRDAAQENALRTSVMSQYMKATPEEQTALAGKHSYLAPLQTVQMMNELDTAKQIELEERKAAIDVEKQKQIEQGKQDIAGSQLAETPFAGLTGLPPNLQSRILEENQNVAQKQGIESFIDQQFNIAKDIPSVGAAMPGTTSANEMEGLRISLTTTIQKALGREMNAKEQERLFKALPDWNDTEGQIELKRNRFKELMRTIAPATPILDSMRGGAVTLKPTIDAPGAAIAAAQYGEAELRAAGYDEADIAQLRVQGLVK